MHKNDVEHIQEAENNLNINRLTVPDVFLEEFHNNITVEKIKNLYLKLKEYEIKGFVTHDKFFESMKEVFDEPIKNQILKLYKENKINKNYITSMKIIDDSIHEIYELYFLRFREVKCLIKNDKTVFYLTDFKPENIINTYNIICSLTVFMKSPFDTKIKLLFALSDIDEDGFLNETEIRHMITTCNFLFCEEANIIHTNSSILSQSLMNIKVNDILKQILYEPGNLYLILEEERYINFELLYNSIIKVKDYKYCILPSFVNLKQCLNNIKKEKIINVENKFKNDFISISSALFTHKSFRTSKNFFRKNSSAPHLGTIIKPTKIIEEDKTKNNQSDKLELPNINQNFFIQRKSLFKSTVCNFNNKNSKNLNPLDIQNPSSKNILSKTVYKGKLYTSRNKNKNKNKLIIEKRKTFKDLLRESTIIETNDDKEQKVKLKNFNKSNYYNKDNRKVKYIFEAYLDKIRNMEVKPGLIKFIGTNDNKEQELNFEIGSSKNIIQLNNNSNNINDNNNKKIRKISEEKKSISAIKMFKLSDKNNNNIHDSVIKEELSSEEKDRKNDKENSKTKLIKKYKLINTQNKSNKFVKQSSKNISYTVKRENKKNLTFKFSPESDNYVKVRNYSFNRKRGSLFKKLQKKIIPNSKAIKIQKNIMNINLKEGNKYKTLDEVFGEIKVQENKFNSDSYGGVGASLLRLSNKIFQEQNDLKKSLKFGDKKSSGIFFGKEYLDRLAKNEEENKDDIKKNIQDKKI